MRRSRFRVVAPAPDWSALRQALWSRCGGFCEACGGRMPELGLWDAHHRRLRSQGGTDTPPNLVAVHHVCHVLGGRSIHERPAWARLRGLIVPSWRDVATAGFLLPDGRQVLLTDDGRYAVVSIGGEQECR